MAVRVLIPTPLRPFTDNRKTVEVDASTVGEALAAVTQRYGGLKKHLYDEDGRLRNFVSVFLNDEDVRGLKSEETAVSDDDELIIVPSIAGGAGEPEVPPSAQALSADEMRRYSRHLILPEVGLDGQLRLKQARVLLVGAGGLGSPLALYLAAAGVGTLGIVDFDVVDESNLQRQVLHDTASIGRSKLDSAIERIRGVNPNVKVEAHRTRLTSENALEIIGKYDLVADGTDNFPTRYLVNDACVLAGKPNVYGSIFRFEGQASVFAHEDGPCYRCLYPEPPPPGLVPSCAEGGVLGVLPGTVGLIQATEVVKLILGTGDPLVGRLLLFDALGMKFRELKLRRDEDCPVCGKNPTVTELIDYEEFCGIMPEATADELGIPEISVVDFKQRIDRGDDLFVLDVREPEEYELVRLPDTILMPMGELPRRASELDSSREIVVYCRTGRRSAKAIEFLQGLGFRKLYNLQGGINAYAREIDTSLPQY